MRMKYGFLNKEVEITLFLLFIAHVCMLSEQLITV